LSIYVRPVREQIEHDRVIRHLHSKFKRKFDVAMNVGAEQAAASVKAGAQVLYPDLVLTTTDRGRKVAAVIEVETGESVHHLEAMAQWAPFSRLRIPFHLYVPTASADIARRLAADLGAQITELWGYHTIGDQVRLTLVEKSAVTPGPRGATGAKAAKAAKPAAKAKPAKAAKSAKAAKPAKAAKSARPAKSAKPAKAAKPAKSAKAAKAAKKAPARAAKKAKTPARGRARR